MDEETIEIAFVVPRSGPSGIYGPSCEASGQMAVAEINDRGGILERKVRLRDVDGGQRPSRVADEVEELVKSGAVSAVTGWHTSAVRERLAGRLRSRVPYVYTAVYEGGECTPGVFLTGETPDQQLIPAMRWMAQELGVRRWCVVGNDYIWPRGTARAARAYAHSVGAEIRGEIFVGLGCDDFGGVLRRLEKLEVQGVLMFLLGSDAVKFNRSFTEMRLPDKYVRLSPLMDENMLLGSGAAGVDNLYSAAGFFETLVTADSLDFERRYVDRMGPSAPIIASPGESCFEGMTLLAQLTAAAGSTDVGRIGEVAESVAYEGPRGAVRVRNNHLIQRIYIARAAGLEFDVLAEINRGP
jgi:urea transport system substrate-binding protein